MSLRSQVNLASLFFALLALPALAAEEIPEGPDRRILGGHRFQPSHRIDDPFVTTHLRTVTGAGLATGFETPFVDTSGDTLGILEGDLAFFSLFFEFQKNLFEWGSIRLEVSGNGRAGTDEQSVLADGLNTVYGLVLQGKAAVLRREESQVSVIATFSRKNLYGLDPFGFAQRVVEEGGLSEDNSLVVDADIHRYSAGLAGAHAVRPWLGLFGFVEVGSAKPAADQDPNETLFQAGMAAGFDLLPWKGYPIGFLLGYDYDSFPEGGADVAEGVHSGTFGINYTGRREFHVGLEFTSSQLKQTEAEKTLAGNSALLNLKYFF